MGLLFCQRCQHHYKSGFDCPSCSSIHPSGFLRKSGTTTALLLGLSLVGCAEKEDLQPAYGVPMQDADGDGFFIDEDDCDDEDAEINPNAEETPGDGVDSNCDGEDDT